MNKTTLYLPDDLKEAVKQEAARRGVSEAEVIRVSLRSTIGTSRPKPAGALFASGGRDPMAHRVDELLEGFGEA
ncbi:CopG family transcriptional regulator [Nesterenkonia muleiensis]|uniref:ribbon-helix-helix domain-containing protein n=1 Tax=Nesterenkonia muleiensis TaxID=2282648 RepID=UPI000E723829|nr:CopG family transcriptional regulator [Nesterenkonia muleiensis]